VRAAITSSGSVSPSPPQTAGADPVIGVSNIGRFTITPASVVNSDVATIGQQPAGIGYVVVSGFDESVGAGAVWNTNNLIVGSFGTGSLEVLDGAVVTVDFGSNPGSGDLQIGVNPDSVGTVLVSGRGSLMRIGDDTFIGYGTSGVGGSGTLIIEDEGYVVATNDVGTAVDTVTVGTRGRVELNNGRLRAEDLDNNGVIIGHGRIDGEFTISNLVGGRVEVRSGERMVVNGGATGGLGFDNDGDVVVRGGEIEFLEQFTNSNQAASVTLRDGGSVHFPTTGFGFDSTGGVLATTAGTNDIYGTVRIQGASSRILVAANSTAVFHDPVTNSGAAIDVHPGGTAVYLNGLTVSGASSVLAVHVNDPADATESGQVEVAGTAQLAGTVQVTLANGFAPLPGERFTVLRSDGLGGTAFSDATLTNPGVGIQLHPVHTATDAAVFVAGAGDKTWGVDASGASSAGGNWLGGVAPGGVDDRAAFTTIINADRTVTVDAPLTVGTLYFDDNNRYTLAGPAGITLDVTSGQARIDVRNFHGSGTHVIAAPLTLNDDTTVDVPGGSTLRIDAPMSAADSVLLSKQGAGTVNVKHVRAAALAVNGGVVRVEPTGGAPDGTSVVKSLDVTTRLDLTDNKLIVTGESIGTFSGGAYSGVSGLIASSYNSSTWTGPGITTSMPAAGPLIGTTTLAISTAAASQHAGGTFGGVSVAGSDVLVMYTYAGDLNLDGLVDAQDYGIIDNWVQFPGTSGYANGDINFDGVIDAGDYGIIDNTIQMQGPPIPVNGAAIAAVGTVQAVPEPAAAALAFVAITFGARRHRYRR
jgi:T5SS/PEP-CTERM-associated repeat protein